MGTAMDSAAYHELIAQVRGTAAALAEAEQKVAAFKAELAQQEHGAQLDSALQRAIRAIPKRVNSGWLPATDPHAQRRIARRGRDFTGDQPMKKPARAGEGRR
jgi:hypothetical protein